MRLVKNRSSVLLIFTVFLLLLICSGGFYSMYITDSISNDAMIINKLGIVRGSIQRVSKLELNGIHNDEVMNKIDSTINEFKSETIKIHDKNNEVINAIINLDNSWTSLKKTITEYRADSSENNREALVKASEDAWYKANSMVFVSQLSSENKLSNFNYSFALFFINIGLSILILFLIKKYVKDSLEYMANFDSLTKVYNRRFYNEYISRELGRCERYNKIFSIIMLDIDYFKKINDKYGHDAGDEVLKELANLTRECIRKSDVFARIGGEEFIVALPETDLGNAMMLAEKLRQRVANYTFFKDIKATISLGITQYQAGDNENTLYKRADNALYRAKNNGRNRCEAESIGNNIVNI